MSVDNLSLRRHPPNGPPLSLPHSKPQYTQETRTHSKPLPMSLASRAEMCSFKVRVLLRYTHICLDRAMWDVWLSLLTSRQALSCPLMLTHFLSDALTEDGKPPSQIISGTVPCSYRLLRVEDILSLQQSPRTRPQPHQGFPQNDSVSIEKERQSEPRMSVNVVLL